MPDTPLYGCDLMEFDAGSADNAIVTVTLAAVAGRRHVLRHVIAGYDDVMAATAEGRLSIVWTRNGVAKTALIPCGNSVAGNPLIDSHFEDGEIVGDVNTAITLTLPASGQADAFGYVNVWHRL